jgi:hypothetical protein
LSDDDRVKCVVRLDPDLHKWFTKTFLRSHHGGVQWFLEETVRMAREMYEDGRLQAPHDVIEDVIHEVYRRNL